MSTLNNIPYTPAVESVDHWVRDQAALRFIYGKNPLQRDAVGRFPLARALELGYHTTFLFLLERGADIGVPFNSTFTVLEVILHHDLAIIDQIIGEVRWNTYTKEHKGVLLAQAYHMFFGGTTCLTEGWLAHFKTEVLGIEG